MMQIIRIEEPEFHLENVDHCELPDYLVLVRAAADMLLGMALHPKTEEGRDSVLWVIDRALDHLAEARETISQLDYIMPTKDETAGFNHKTRELHFEPGFEVFEEKT